MAKNHSNLLNLLKGKKNQNNTSSKKKRKRNHNKNKAKKYYSNENDNIPNQSNNDSKNNSQISIYDKQKELERPIWMKIETQAITNSSERFGKELMDYYYYIIPQNCSLTERQNTILNLTNIIKKYNPNWKVLLFGSFSQNLSTVFSDLDFCIIDNNENCSSRKRDINKLFNLMKILKREKFYSKIILIKARVPILKLVCKENDINIDISMNHINGCQTGLLIRKILDKNFLLKPVIILLKVLLKMYDLNEASSGGMSSFLLFHLVFFYYNKYKKEIYEKNIFNQMYKINEEEKEYKLLCEDISNNSNGNDINMELSSFDSNSNIKSINSYDNSTYSSKTVLSTFEEDYSNNYDPNLTKNNSNGIQSKTTSKYINENDNLYIGNSDSNIDYISESMYSTKSSNKHEKSNDEIINLGEFLLSFLKFYGYDFDYENLGFSINKNNFCTTFFKIERTDMECGNGLCVESLQDKGVNVGKICYNYSKIVSLFKEIYGKIKIGIKNNTCSILKSLGFP